MKKPAISLDINSFVEFTPEDLWPDGDAPEPITAEDVARVIDQCGGLHRVIIDWNLRLFGLIYSVDLNPAYGQDETLFPEHAPTKWVETSLEIGG